MERGAEGAPQRAHQAGPVDRVGFGLTWIQVAAAAVAGWGVVQIIGRLHGRVPPASASEGYFLSWPLGGALAGPGYAAVTIAALGVVGLVAGIVNPRRGWMLGAATVALFPIVMTVEASLDPTTHSLAPFEVAMYVILAGPAVVGALVASLLRSWIDRNSQVARS